MTTLAGLAETLVTYVPAPVVRRYTSDRAPPASSAEDRFAAATLYADVSGFTPLGERLARQGAVGSEELTRILNQCFDRLGALITDHGGEIVSFAGDALLAVWPCPEEELTIVLPRAAQCALEVQSALHGVEVGEGVKLSLKIGLGAGEVSGLHVGGISGRWLFVLAGTAVVQATVAEQAAAPGEIVLSAQAATVAKGSVGEELSGGSFRLKSLSDPPEPRPAPDLPSARDAEAALAAYVPAPVLTRLAEGQRDWLAELRLVTAVFSKLVDFDPAGPGGLEKMQTITQSMQAITERCEGTLHLSFDDKGMMIINVFGLPPFVHEDDASRAVRAAQAMDEELGQVGVSVAQGIATGRAFCGPIGSSRRREYCVIGPVMNLAARLSQATSRGLLCDSPTYEAAKRRLLMEPLPPMSIKGRSGPVATFRPAGQSRAPTAARSIFGREAEKALLTARMHDLIEGKSGTLVIEGPPGIGKSRLIYELEAMAKSLGITTLTGSGDPVERNKAYHAWRPLYERVFGTERLTREELRAHVAERFAGDPQGLALSPLLNSVLPLDLPDNEVTVQMAGSVRSGNTIDLCVRVLQGYRRGDEPLLIILEDGHWLDSSSWALAHTLRGRLERMLLVVTTRPSEDGSSSKEQRLLEGSRAKKIVLGALSSDAVISLVTERLGVGAVPEPIPRFILERAQGNPFFAEELAYTLRDTGVVSIDGNGRCLLSSEAGSPSTWSVPETLEGVIASRIDRLSSRQQLTMKVASVIGRAFTLELLRSVYPIDEDRPRLPGHLQALESLDLILLDSEQPELTYLFKHVLTQQVAYNLMLFEQRRRLHRQLAEWYEHIHADDLSPVYPLLAHHWGETQDAEKTMKYAGLAGEQAVHKGAYQEAVAFLIEALRFNSERQRRTTWRPQREVHARWERDLGEAFLGLGRTAEGREHLIRALDVLGAPPPRTRFDLGKSMLREVPAQFMHRTLGRRFRSTRRDPQALLEASRAYMRLTEVHWFANDVPSLGHAGIRALNLAETAGPSRELARAFAMMCLAAGSIPLHRLARIYGRRAVETAQVVGEPWPLAYARFIITVYAIGTGAWEEIREALDEVEEVFERVGDLRALGDTRTVRAMSFLYRGDFTNASPLFDQVLDMGRTNENIQHRIWGLIGKAECEFRQGRHDDAVHLLEVALEALVDYPDRAEPLRASGLLAAVHLRRGDASAARQAADRAESLINELFVPTAHYLLEGYAGNAEVRLHLWEAGDASAPTRTAARRACRSLRKFARIFPIGQPRSFRLQGDLEWLSGRHARALKRWKKGLAAAEHLGMRFEEAFAHWEIARHQPDSDPLGRVHLERARELWDEMDLPYRLVEESHRDRA